MNGILFKPEMIQAIIEGRKTQTRRIMKPQPDIFEFNGGVWLGWVKDHTHGFLPRYHIGQKLYIKEAHYAYGYWTTNSFTESGRPKWEFVMLGNKVTFLNEPKPDNVLRGNGGAGHYLRSPLFLFEKHARYFIEITNVEPQRLQEITFEDITAEGVDTGQDIHYQELWNSINKPPYDWASNCWVWKYTFKQVK